MSDINISKTGISSIAAMPEFGVAVFSFLLHFVWEFIQVPTYEGMAEMAHWNAIKICTWATFGDVGFALTAFWTTALMARSRSWIYSPQAWQMLIYLGVGIGLTIGFEYYYTEIAQRFSYSDLMPLVPPLGTGLSPLLQWIVIPLLVIWFTRRFVQGSKV
ncbi:MAG: hypothetical protein OXR62_03230 [Ahrensia sp.]|nr:hypothetical protein [Ahrensia sp.]